MEEKVGAKDFLQHVEATGPVAAVDADPLVRTHQRDGIEATDIRAAADVAPHQPGGFEHFDMLRRRGERHGERFGEFAHRPFAGGKFAQHRAARRVAERVEDCVEGVRIMFNHVVEYGRLGFYCQPIG